MLIKLNCGHYHEQQDYILNNNKCVICQDAYYRDLQDFQDEEYEEWIRLMEISYNAIDKE